MSAPIRLTAVLVHPVQYYAPWFRQIAAECPEIDLTVVYATEPTPEQQGVGFGRAFTWDVPLTDGYRCQVVRPARPEDGLHSGSFRGVDVPGIGEAVLATRPDVALIPGWYSVTLLRAIRACRRAGVPVLYRGDSNLASAPSGLKRLAWRARTRLRLRAYDGYLATGTRSREYLESFGIRPERLFDSPHCVDNDLFARQAAPFQTAEGRRAAREALGLAADAFVVLFAGKLDPVKRPLDLVHALRFLGPGAQLLMVGGGELEAECRRAAAALGVAESVVWAGFLNQTEMARAYAAADGLALPSASETWGLVVNEAMATGLPCVVSDRVGCAPDLVIPGETGEVFPAGDAGDREALARAIERVRTGPDRGPACRARAAAHSFAAATAGLLAACRHADGVRRKAPLAPPRRGAGAAGVSSRVLAGCGGMVSVSGLERMTFEVLRGLRRQGAEVHCVFNVWENHRVVPLAEAIGASWTTGPYWETFDRHTRDPRKALRMAVDILRTSLALLRDARRFRPTHVLMSEFLSVIRNAPALALLRLLGIPVILRVGVAPTPGPAYRKVWRWGVAPFVDTLVANSDFTRGEILAHGIPAARVERIYNTVPLRARPPAAVPTDPGKVVYAGQIIPPKGVHLLLDAVGLLVARGLDVRLDVIGQIDGWEAPPFAGYRAGLVARAGQPDLAGRVRFLGWQDDVPALMATAAVHACPSLPEIREAFGVVSLEAKQVGIPSVAFRAGAQPELIRHRVDGWICDDVTAEALAEGLAFFLADPERRAAAGQAARESLARFSREEFDEAWWRLFAPGARRRTAPRGDDARATPVSAGRPPA
jgi:glycosyltransferase involved in cell wall biosynthesis